ncbi:MAG: hypothetical protein RRZ93_07790, partial [Ruthenibacterium sp.]
WIMGKGRADLWEPMEGINWIGIISWIVGAAVAKWSTFFVPTITGILAAIVVYCVLSAVIKNEKVNPIYAMQLKLKGAEKTAK